MKRDLAIGTLRRLRAAGFQAFFAGGCVRDQFLGIPPRDYDIATDARPEQVVQLFPQSLTVGAQFGVVLVSGNGVFCEVATFRSDGIYDDGRHPREVVFSKDPRQDVLRRDFTMNGLLYDPVADKVLDYVGGEADIRERVLRTIGNPAERFNEDRLRLIRAARFASRFDFCIETETRESIMDFAGQISSVSRERIRDELVKILTEGYAAKGLQLLDECGLLPHLLPDVSSLKGVAQPPEYHPEGDVWVHTLLMLELMDQTRSKRVTQDRSNEANGTGAVGMGYPSVTLALGVLLHDIGKPLTYEVSDRIRFNNHAEIGARRVAAICDRYRIPSKDSERIVQLVRDHLKFKDLPRMRLSTLKRFLRQDNFEEHLELHRLDCLGSHRNLDNWNYAVAMLEHLGPEEIRPPRLLTGTDLIALGFTPGPYFKEILTSVEDAQLDGMIKSHQEARELVVEKYWKKDGGS
jgi:poly(A) polymerase